MNCPAPSAGLAIGIDPRHGAKWAFSRLDPVLDHPLRDWFAVQRHHKPHTAGTNASFLAVTIQAVLGHNRRAFAFLAGGPCCHHTWSSRFPFQNRKFGYSGQRPVRGVAEKGNSGSESAEGLRARRGWPRPPSFCPSARCAPHRPDAGHFLGLHGVSETCLLIVPQRANLPCDGITVADWILTLYSVYDGIERVFGWSFKTPAP